MGRYLLRRLLHSILVLAGVLSVVFVIGHGLGDPAKLMLPIDASEEQVRALRTRLGLEDPFLMQFGRFAAGAAVGDFGDSLQMKVPALGLVMSRIPATLYLAAVTILLTVLPAVALGTLAVQPMGRIAQVTRSTMMDELSKPYVVTARSKGLREGAVITFHALKNAALPIITLVGHEGASLLNGAVVVETIFAWPGVGILLIDSIGRRDLPLVEATVFVIAVMIMLLNLMVDLAYAYVNPRISYE